MKTYEPGATIIRHQTAASAAARQLRMTRSGGPQASIDCSPHILAQRRVIDAVFGQTERAGQPLEGHAAPASGTGLPDGLKAGMEALSGSDMSGVRVHRNSARPAQLNALAYAQGRDIHLGPGQEQHLPHEAWHLVQQAQGRVRPTLQMKEAGVSINDDESLEREADEMGRKALQSQDAGAQSPAQGPLGNLSPLEDSGGTGLPVQAVMSVADFQASTPALFLAPRKSVANIDGALDTYIGPPRTVMNATPLINTLTHYRANSDQPGRVAAAGVLLDRVNLEHDVLQVIGNANENVLDALIDTVTPAHVPALVQLATVMTPVAAQVLLPLIPLVGIGNLADANLLACVAAAGPGGHGLLLSIIPMIGGLVHLPSLAAVMVGGHGAADAFDLARVAGGGAEFMRLAAMVPLFHDPAVPAPAAVPGPVTAERDAYNNAKDAGYAALVAAHVTTMVNEANTMRLTGTQFHAPFAQLINISQQYTDLDNFRASIVAGPPLTVTPNDLAAKAGLLRARLNGMLAWATAQPVDLAGHRAAILAAHANFVAAQNNFALAAVPVGTGAMRDLETIDYPHFFERHTHEHFDFGDIKALNTMWPSAWGNAPVAPLDATLVASINQLHTNNRWLANNVPQANIPTGAGTQSHIIAYNTGNNTLRLGMYYPEPNGAPIHQYTADVLRALRRLL